MSTFNCKRDCNGNYLFDIAPNGAKLCLPDEVCFRGVDITDQLITLLNQSIANNTYTDPDTGIIFLVQPDNSDFGPQVSDRQSEAATECLMPCCDEAPTKLAIKFLKETPIPYNGDFKDHRIKAQMAAALASPLAYRWLKIDEEISNQQNGCYYWVLGSAWITDDSNLGGIVDIQQPGGAPIEAYTGDSYTFEYAVEAFLECIGVGNFGVNNFNFTITISWVMRNRATNLITNEFVGSQGNTFSYNFVTNLAPVGDTCGAVLCSALKSHSFDPGLTQIWEAFFTTEPNPNFGQQAYTRLRPYVKNCGGKFPNEPISVQGDFNSTTPAPPPTIP